MTLTASTTAVGVNGTAQIIAQILEPSGTPPHSGTQVLFTTTLGTIEPSEIESDINGRAIAVFKAGNSNGTATITASSGGASVSAANGLKIAVGTAAVGRVVVSANPTLIAALGGTSVITAAVSDINGNVLALAPVAFSTTAGSVNPSIANTDANGIATTSLQTTTTATVTASVGATGSTGGGTGTGGTTTPPAASGQASGSVTVNVASAPGLVITLPTTPPSAGLPASFTFAVTVPATNGSAIRSLVVNWGDGESSNLGAVTGTAPASHTYRSAGTYVITATLTDSIGNVVQQSAPVSVIPVPGAGIQITPSPIPGKVNTAMTFGIQVTLPTGLAVQELVINYGDGFQDALGATQSANPQHVYTTQGTFTVTVTVRDTLDRVTTGSTRVSVGP